MIAVGALLQLMVLAEASGEVLLSPDLAEDVESEVSLSRASPARTPNVTMTNLQVIDRRILCRQVECFSFEVGGKGSGGAEAFRARYFTKPPDADFAESGL